MDDDSETRAQLHEVEQLIRSRNKIGAIKALRELADFGLKQAKDAVEHFEARGHWSGEALALLGSRAPSRTRGPAHAAGDARAALLGLLSRRGPPPSGGAPKRQPAPRGIDRPGASKPLATVRTTGTPATAAPVTDAREAAARRVLEAKFGNGEPVLGAVTSECGFYKGFLFVTRARVAFVAERFGSWELTENLERAELERVEVKADPFGFELVIQASVHTAHFSELERSQAEALARFLKGERSNLELAPAAKVPGPPRSGIPSELPQATVQPLPPQAPLEPPRSALAAPGASPATAGAPPKPFRLGSLLFAALVAGLPVALYGSAWRFVPMDEFPAVVDRVLYWSAVALGGGMLRGPTGRLLQAAFVAGLLAWVLGELSSMHVPSRLVPLAILGGTFVSANGAGRGALLGAFAAIPVFVLEGFFAPISVGLGFYIPTVGFSLWLVLFALQDFRSRRPALQTTKPPA